MIQQNRAGQKYSGFLKTAEEFLSKGPVALTLFCALIITLACENLLDFPLSVPYMLRTTGNVYLDMHMLYSVESAYALLDAFGLEGRRLQLLLLPSIDILIPILSGFAGFAMISFLFKNSSGRTRSFGKFKTIALIATAVDFLENAGIFLMLTFYPQRLDSIALATGILTALKFLFYLVTILFILAGTVYRAFLPIGSTQRKKYEVQ